MNDQHGGNIIVLMQRMRFSTKIIIILSSMISIVFAVQSAQFIGKNYADQRFELALRADLVVEMQSVAVSGALWDLDKEGVLRSLAGVLKDPEVIKATVYDDTGEIFAEVINPNFGMDDWKLSTVLSVSHDIQISEFEKDQKIQIGQVKILWTASKSEIALKDNIINSILITLVIIFAVIIGFTVVIRSFSKPIFDMTEIMRRRSNADFSGGLKDRYLNRQDEIGDIARSLHQDQNNRRDEARLLAVTSAIGTELDLDILLQQIIAASSELLNAERSTLFLYDKKRNILWSSIAEGLDESVIELRPGEGIAGHVWQTRNPEIVHDPYNDDRFDGTVDKRTGFLTRNIICLPIINREEKVIGVTQTVNKKDGVFTERDIQRLTALTAQVSAALENAQLFNNVLSVRNYNESILRSLTNGVVSLDRKRKIQKINSAAERILGRTNAEVEGYGLATVLGPSNPWVLEAVDQVEKTNKLRQISDNTLNSEAAGGIAVNLSVAPLLNIEKKKNGFLAVFDDISQEKRVRNTMLRYMPGPVVDQLLDNSEKTLDGALQTVTMLFSDIRGFTTTSEKIGARATVAMLNEYLSLMVDIIEKHEGILDKYIGDAVMALFGAPFPDTNDPSHAVQTAWAMLESVECLNQVRLSRGETRIDIGVGLNTGEVVVGNIGSDRRMDYTVIGDAVNLAARLESVTKTYSTQLIISEFTLEALPESEASRFREIDLLRVKGKSEPISIFEGVGKRHPVLEHMKEWDEAMDAYRRQEWICAREGFLNLRGLFSSVLSSQSNGRGLYDDPVIKIYLDRIEQFEKQPPGSGWDGVFNMETK